MTTSLSSQSPAWSIAVTAVQHDLFERVALLEFAAGVADLRAERATEELFALAAELGGSVSGEHGIGWVKRGALAQQWEPAALAMHEAIKQTFDPKGLLNPGKKLARGRRTAAGDSPRPREMRGPAMA